MAGRRQRQALTAVTLLVLMGILATGAVLGVAALTKPTTQGEDAGPTCLSTYAVGDVVKTKDITVSVFNAGSRAGLASEVGNALETRGFVSGDVGNAPSSQGAVRFVRVYSTSADDPAAALVARQFGKNTVVEVSESDLGAGIDVVVGDSYVRLIKAPRKFKVNTVPEGCERGRP